MFKSSEYYFDWINFNLVFREKRIFIKKLEWINWFALISRIEGNRRKKKLMQNPPDIHENAMNCSEMHFMEHQHCSIHWTSLIFVLNRFTHTRNLFVLLGKWVWINSWAGLNELAILPTAEMVIERRHNQHLQSSTAQDRVKTVH